MSENQKYISQTYYIHTLVCCPITSECWLQDLGAENVKYLSYENFQYFGMGEKQLIRLISPLTFGVLFELELWTLTVINWLGRLDWLGGLTEQNMSFSSYLDEK